tara:strand:- start:205 stop:396 length:192 start_codon:yes stop_codon:yes gene_type:complete
MPEYRAKIRNKKGRAKTRVVKIFAGCYSDAESEAQREAKRGEYVYSLDNVNFPKDKFKVLSRG